MKKEFDCVRMARECNERVSRLLNAMSVEERIAFLEKSGRGGAVGAQLAPGVSGPVVREDEREWGGKEMESSRALRLYIDTSVVGGYFDAEWEKATRTLWRQWREGHWVFVTSTVAEAEMLGAPEHVRELFAETFPEDALLPSGEEAERLAGQYLDAGVLPGKFSDDARHVAACVTAGCTVLVSWNFRHLTNVRREAGFNTVNTLQGYPTLRIVSPLELIYEGE